MKLSSSLVFLVTAIAACTGEPDTSDLGTTTQAGAASYECMDICLPGYPCHHVCFFFPATPDDKGPATGTGGGSKCDALRPIDVCGDGCCDPDEAGHFPQPPSCRADCQLERIDVTLMEDKRVHVTYQERSIATVIDDLLVVDPTCQ